MCTAENADADAQSPMCSNAHRRSRRGCDPASDSQRCTRTDSKRHPDEGKRMDDVLQRCGIIPDDDMQQLNKMGVGKLFAPGAVTSDSRTILPGG